MKIESMKNLCFGIPRRAFVASRRLSSFGLFVPTAKQGLAFHTSNHIDLFKDIKNLDDALLVFDEMLQLKPKPSLCLYAKLLNVIVKTGHYSHVILLVKKLSLSGSPGNEYNMSTLINCYCNLKETDLGFAVFASFLKRGYSLDIVTITCLIKGFFLEGNVEKAVELFMKLIKHKLCEPNQFTFSTMLNGLCKCGNVVSAVRLLELLEEENCKLNVVVYNTVINGLCKVMMLDDAISLLSKMIERGIFPDVFTYRPLIHGLSVVGRWDEAKKFLKQMVDYKIYPDIRTFTILVDVLCKEGLIKDREGALKTLRDQSVHPDMVNYNSLMDGYCLQDKPDKENELLDLMVAEGLKHDVVSNGYCKHKKVDYAWHIFEEMPHKGLKVSVSAYNSMLQGLFSVGKSSLAVKLFTNMNNVGLVPDFYTYGIVLYGLLENEKSEDASYSIMG